MSDSFVCLTKSVDFETEGIVPLSSFGLYCTLNLESSENLLNKLKK